MRWVKKGKCIIGTSTIVRREKQKKNQEIVFKINARSFELNSRELTCENEFTFFSKKRKLGKQKQGSSPAGIYLFKANNGNTGTMCEICISHIVLHCITSVLHYDPLTQGSTIPHRVQSYLN